MISDEMRELLSSYVDGELRDSDAARVEEFSKRDPELRREIAAYRMLRRKLRDWDDAEHGVEPAPTLARRAIARAKTYLAEQPAPVGRLVRIVFHPATVAAAILLAVASGVAASRMAPHPVTPPIEVAGNDGDGVLPPPPQPWEDPTLPGSALVEYVPPEASDAPRGRLSDHLLSQRAAEFVKAQDRMEQRWERQKARILERPASRTGTRSNLAVMAMIDGYSAVGEPYEGFVILNHPRVGDKLPEAHAIPTGSRLAMDQGTEKSIFLDLSRVRHAVLTPLGEVWIGSRDGSGRTRLVTASSWGAHAADFIPMVFADRVAVPKDRRNLEVQPFIVGPQARQRLLIEGTRGKDPKFLDWMVKRYRARTLKEAFAKNGAEREAEVTKLMRSLAKDTSATGFAVFGTDGKLRGIELFANHRLMKEFAPRLLRGYLLEAGEKGIRLAQPDAAKGATSDLVTEALEGLASKVSKLDFTETDLPDGVRRVNLRRALGDVLAHGLVDAQNHPVHLTIFG